MARKLFINDSEYSIENIEIQFDDTEGILMYKILNFSDNSAIEFSNTIIMQFDEKWARFDDPKIQFLDDNMLIIGIKNRIKAVNMISHGL